MDDVLTELRETLDRLGGALALLGLPAALVVGFLGVVGLAHDGYRFVLTESCTTRLQQLLIAGNPPR